MKFLATILALLSVLTPAQSVFRRPIVLPAGGPITLVNTAATPGDFNSATTVATPAISLAAGNLVVITVTWRSTPATVSSITDTAGNTYTRIAGVTTASSELLDLWYAQNTLGNASNVITATFSEAATMRVIIAAQYSGIKTTGALDVSATGADYVTNINSGNFTTTQADELLVTSAVSFTDQTWTPGTGYTIQASGDDEVKFSDRIVATIQTNVHAGFAGTDDSSKGIVAATFKKN